jgi:hypothetical protein
MPRSDKPISTGNLTEPVSSSRSRTWSSRDTGIDTDHLEPDGLVVVDPLTHEVAEDETVVNLMDAKAPTVVIRKPEPLLRRPGQTPVYGWTTVREIEGRTYTRRDERHEASETE